jgi:hypothetical protein
MHGRCVAASAIETWHSQQITRAKQKLAEPQGTRAHELFLTRFPHHVVSNRITNSSVVIHTMSAGPSTLPPSQAPSTLEYGGGA